MLVSGASVALLPTALAVSTSEPGYPAIRASAGPTSTATLARIVRSREENGFAAGAALQLWMRKTDSQF